MAEGRFARDLACRLVAIQPIYAAGAMTWASGVREMAAGLGMVAAVSTGFLVGQQPGYLGRLPYRSTHGLALDGLDRSKAASVVKAHSRAN